MNKDFPKLAEELTSRLGGLTEAAKVEVILTKGHIFEDNKVIELDTYEGIDICPCDGNSLYCMEEVVDFCRYHKLSEFVTMAQKWDSEHGQSTTTIKCHVF